MTGTHAGQAAVMSGFLISVLDSLDVALTCYDLDDRLVWWNTAAATFFPRAQHTLIAGMRAEERRRVKGEAGYNPARRSTRGPAPALDIEELNLADGRRMMRQRVRLPTGHKIVCYIDVSRRLTAESEAVAALKAERERYALMIEGTRDGLYDCDMISRTTWYSPRAHEILGFPDGALNDVHEGMKERLHPEDLAGYEKGLNEAFSRREPMTTATGRLRHADGSWRWITFKARIIYSDSGAVARLVGSWSDVTAQKEAEERLRASEERYERVLEATSDGIYDRDFIGDTIWFSKRTHDMLGLPDGALNGALEKIVGLVWPPDLEAHDRGLAEAWRRKAPSFAADLRVKHADGSWRWTASRERLVYDDFGQVIRTVGSISDVTAQKTAEEALRESEKLLRDAQRLARVGSWKWGADGRRFWSEQMYDLFPLPRDVVPTPAQLIEMIHPEDRDRIGLSYVSAERTDAAALRPESQYRVRWPDGRTLILAERAVVERDDSGAVISVAGTIQDVTESVETQQAIQTAENELRRLSDEKQKQVDELARRSLLLQRVMDTVTDGMVVVADDGGAVFWNQGFLKLVALSQGTSPDTLGGPTGATLADLLALLKLDWENIDGLLKEGAKERECVLGDGRALQIQVLRSGEGNSLLWISDITRRREEEIERMALQERLLQSQKNDAIGAIAGTVSHDFNNLLTIILGFATLSRSQLDVLQTLPAKLPTTDPHAKRTVDHVLKATDSIAKSLDNIISGASRGKAIVANLTSFAKRRPSDLAVGNLSQTMESTMRLIGASMPASVTFKTSGIDVPLPVRHDRGKIEQVLLNLCINSAYAIGDRAGSITVRTSRIRTDGGRADAMPAADDEAGTQRILMQEDAGGWGHLWYGRLSPGDYVRIDVTDNGSGMKAEVMRQIFDPFFTTKPQGQGTGLGLLSVSRIIEEHGGAIHVRSRTGDGTVFSIFLPLADTGMEAIDPVLVPAADPTADAGDDEVRETASRNLVLVVDDEENLTELVQLSLERAGYEIETFNDPDAALKRFKADPEAFELVITDQTMPKMTGMELARMISEVRTGMPVLLCTGYSARAIDEKKLPAGIAGVLRKPFTPKGLVETVRATLHQSD